MNILLNTIANKAFYAPNFEKVGSILLSACPCVSLPVVQKF